jgi:hypothetical protein
MILSVFYWLLYLNCAILFTKVKNLNSKAPDWLTIQMNNGFDRAKADYCPFCDGESKEYFTLTSKFFCEKASGKHTPQITILSSCKNCHSMFFKRQVSQDEMKHLYTDYRGSEYFSVRSKHEPWYTNNINDRIGDEQEFDLRRKVLLSVLDRNSIDNNFKNILDHGGDRGQMISPDGGVNAEFRAVCEISGVTPEKGVVNVSQADAPSYKWDLILSCHVIEHLPDPFSYLTSLRDLGSNDTIYFFEVPNEQHSIAEICSRNYYKDWLAIVARHDALMKIFDLYSLITRRFLGRVMPGGFTAVREHLQFFTVDGFEHILSKTGFTVISCNVEMSGHIVALAKKTSNQQV